MDRPPFLECTSFSILLRATRQPCAEHFLKHQDRHQLLCGFQSWHRKSDPILFCFLILWVQSSMFRQLAKTWSVHETRSPSIALHCHSHQHCEIFLMDE